MNLGASRNPPLRNIIRIAIALGVSVKEFFQDESASKNSGPTGVAVCGVALPGLTMPSLCFLGDGASFDGRNPTTECLSQAAALTRENDEWQGPG